ncbi:hypothetical protein SteCoe_36020 [Stentor coeruleus]|uniref:Uncharacterized protein n=1 Tax=Stentor coeruleus TaxID=5963 RepID=A0A1R2AR15_9CILI|nr:hypothetical protein SteCoe_36020 [Stentor coeruleus]
MKIPILISEYLDTGKKLSPFECSYIENHIFDDCYKLKCDSEQNLPRKCFIIIEDYDIHIKDDNISLTILKAIIKSIRVDDNLSSLCYADHCPQVCESLRKYKHSQIVKKLNYEDSFPIKSGFVGNNIGFGLKSVDKSLKFAKMRMIKKTLGSQDDLLTALNLGNKANSLQEKKDSRVVVENKEKEIIEIQDEELPNFPPWALSFLYYSLKK